MADSELIICSLEKIIGASNLLTSPAEVFRYSVDDIKPLTVVFPSTEEELSEILRFADTHRVSVIPRGQGSLITLGNTPQKVDIILSLSRLYNLIDYDNENLTITVQSGASLSDVNKILYSKKQFIPLDPPSYTLITIGGAISTNISGPLRFFSGTPRDIILGLKVARADGEIIKTGGKTVKNVSGYDLSKIFIGSLGTLGVIIEATLRVFPIPEESKTLIAFFSHLDDVRVAVKSIIKSELTPASIEMINSYCCQIINPFIMNPMNTGQFALIMRIDGIVEAVERQILQTKEICISNKSSISLELEKDTNRKFWEAYRDLFDLISHQYPGVPILKAGLPISNIYEFIHSAIGIANSYNFDSPIISRAGNGIVYISLIPLNSDDESNPLKYAKAIEEIRKAAKNLKGYLIVKSALPELKSIVNVWGTPGQDFTLMKKLKESFDPHNILNPGRFIGGI